MRVSIGQFAIIWEQPGQIINYLKKGRSLRVSDKKSYINQRIVKKDAMALMAGKPLFTDDLTTKDYLIVKALRSPHAFAKIVSIDTSKAKLVPGIECVLTHEDVPHIRFTEAGQTYPEASPYDRYILEDMVRYVGDEVALVAGTTEKAVNLSLIHI